MSSMQNINTHSSSSQDSKSISMYPLKNYYFGSKDTDPAKDATVYDQTERLKGNYAERGVRTYVGAVLLVELFKHPHVLLLQISNSMYKLPGGRLRQGESDIQGLQRKLSKKISSDDDEWEVGECLGSWWRPDFDSTRECTKIYIVHLPEFRRFMVQENQKLIAVPVSQLHENLKTYGLIVSEIPQLLSKYSVNIVDNS